MDGVKIVSVDDSNDKSVYVAAAGRPFFSNIVALAYDYLNPSSNIAYYSDVRRYTSYQQYSIIICSVRKTVAILKQFQH